MPLFAREIHCGNEKSPSLFLCNGPLPTEQFTASSLAHVRICVSKNKRGKIMEWLTVDPTLSHFDCVLLEWCCSTGEMRNHQALTAHVDGNKSHSIETMSAFGRLNPAHAHLGKNETGQIVSRRVFMRIVGDDCTAHPLWKRYLAP